GYDKIIKKVSRKTLVNYYTSRYVPDNMLLVVAGDFETKQMQGKVKDIFGQLKKFKVRAVKRAKESKQTEPRLAVKKGKVEETNFHLAWRVPGASHKDVAALDVLALILGQGDSSRLSRRLRMERPLMNSVGASTFTPKDFGIFTVSGALNADQLDVAFQTLNAELQAILSVPPTAEELRKAVTNFEGEEFYAMETVDGLARKAGSLQTLMGDHQYFKKFLKQVQALKPDDILRVARTYLTPASLTLVMTTPRNEKAIAKFLRQWIKTFGKDYAQSKKARSPSVRRVKLPQTKWNGSGPAKKGEDRLERIQLPGGAKVLFRPSFATPVVNAKAAFLGGLRIEEPGKLGLTELLSRVWTSGTKDFSEAEIQERIENMAGGIGAFGGRNSAGLTLQTLAPFEKDAVQMFDEILTAPVIQAEAVEREKKMMLEALRSREDNPGQVVSQLFIEQMFKGHPYERDTYGQAAAIASFTVEDVKAHWKRMAQAGNLTVVLTGAVERGHWVKALEQASRRLPVGGPLKTDFAHHGPQKDTYAFRKMDREQTHIIVGWKGLTLADPRRFALQVLQSILAGQGGRLFVELRDKASLAYTVSPMRMEGIDTGYFGAYIGCSPEKGGKAIAMMREEFRKLIETPVSSVELERAKRYLIGRHDIDLQRSSAIGSGLLFNEIYGIEAEETFRFAERLAGITPDHVQQVARELFQKPMVFAAVGREQPWP
ncbi:MAG: insulinase family protein, partial [Bdellovibrionaceae bacterium]|nr:insulinase family protein [Pseudobdellovibrionaceae bacterium]